jgi:IclR family transcriptional regulator, KDG regulon repressor
MNSVSDTETSSFPTNQLSGSLNRGLAILLSFRFDRKEWGTTELSRHLALDKATVYRLLKTLERWGFVQKAPRGQRYVLGPAIEQIRSGLLNDRLDDQIHKILERLHKVTQGTVSLRLRSGDRIIAIHKIESSVGLKISIPLWIPYPFDCGAGSKILLADLPGVELRKLIQKSVIRGFPSRKLKTATDLSKHLKDVQIYGYAFSDQEAFVGVRSVAAPVRNAQGSVIAALVVSLPLQLFPLRRLKPLSHLVQEYAHDLTLLTSSEMGGKHVASIFSGLSDKT